MKITLSENARLSAESHADNIRGKSKFRFIDCKGCLSSSKTNRVCKQIFLITRVSIYSKGMVE